MKFENIPAELKREKAWVNVWNSSKIPMRSFEFKAASSSSSDTWSDYNVAEENVKNGNYDGIGYVFHDTGLVGIDIDSGFEYGLLTGLAVEIMSHCASYTEKSRSGRGIHILVRGEIPFSGKNNREGVEIYKSNRFFIMTGDVLIFTEIQENQKALDYVIANYFQEQFRESSTTFSEKTYSPLYEKPSHGKIPLRPTYPEIMPGSRNICLTSLAGKLHSLGYKKKDIYREVSHANTVACTPPLPQREIESIVNSITRYRR